MNKDVSPDLNNSNNLPDQKRRSFLSKALGIISTIFAGFVIYPMLKFLKQPLASEGTVNRVIAAKAAEMTNDSSKIFRFGDAPAMLI